MHSRRLLSLVLFLSVLLSGPSQSLIAQSSASRTHSWVDPYRDPSARLVGEALASRHAWERLAELGDTFGHRLSGSRALEDAIDWAVEQMKKDGLENVHKEPVKVPHWVRGRESLQIVVPQGPRPRDTRARQQRRHRARGRRRRAADRPQLSGARHRWAADQGKNRPLQRPVHQLRRDGAVPRRRVRRAPRHSARSRRSSVP